MQLVSREIFDDITSEIDVVNDSDDAFSYSSIVDMTEYLIRSGKNITETYVAIVSDYLRHHSPPVRYIAKGTSRAAFALSGGKCLKLAINTKGVGQNRQELKNCKSKKQYSCFPTYFDYDAKNHMSLLTECCAPCTADDWKDIYGVTIHQVIGAVEQIVEAKCDYNAALSRINAKANDDINGSSAKYYLTISKLILNIVRSNSLQYNVIKDLIQFYSDNGASKLDFHDLTNVKNWGLASINSEKILVIIDAGFSASVERNYYKDESEKLEEDAVMGADAPSGASDIAAPSSTPSDVVSHNAGAIKHDDVLGKFEKGEGCMGNNNYAPDIMFTRGRYVGSPAYPKSKKKKKKSK